MPTTDRLRSALSDRYAIERELGAGGMATVYLARDLKHDREVALKVLRPDLSAVIGAERFLAEVRITARLDHPHILTLIDSGEADGILFYVLPYVRGESLRVKIEREKQLDMEEAVSITRQIASALDYAHKQGVVHRDIKPENILLHEGEAVLADFGIALAVKEAGGNRLTETGLSLGTPQYMSPEQATGDRTLDSRSDIYSLAAVFYEMIAGEPPVTGATAQAMIAKLLTERPTKLRIVRDTVPEAVERAVEKALAKTPADRYSSAGAFVATLSTAFEAANAPATRGLSRATLVGFGVAAVAIAGIAWFAATRGRSSGPLVSVRDHAQLTNTGNVHNPEVSPDGKTLAYGVSHCGTTGCTYSIELQDVGGPGSRRLLDGASALYGMSWSPDRRNLLFRASIAGRYGVFIIPTLGGAPRRVSPADAEFISNGDSLATMGPDKLRKEWWIYVSGLDGTRVDSIRVDLPGDNIGTFRSVPGSRWILIGVRRKGSVEFQFVDRHGKVGSNWSYPVASHLQQTYLSGDALWVAMNAGAGTPANLVRIPLDTNTGRISERRDTVYSAVFNAFSVTSDGSSIVFGEGSSEFSAWLMPLADALRGQFGADQRIDRSTSPMGMSVSPTGDRAMLSHIATGTGSTRRFSMKNLRSGVETPFPLAGDIAGFGFMTADMVTVAERLKAGFRLGHVDANTGKVRDWFVLPDADYLDYASFGDRGWAWLPSDRSVAVTVDGREVKRYPVPKWFNQAYDVTVSADTRRIAITGFSAPDEDSIGVAVLSIADGTWRHVFTTFGENAGVRALADGSFNLRIADTPDFMSLYQITNTGATRKLGSIPRAVTVAWVTNDGTHAVVMTREDRGDAWLAKVVKH